MPRLLPAVAIVLSLGLTLAACGIALPNPDASAAPSSGCRPPAACYATTCGCTRPVHGIDLCQRACVDAGTDGGLCNCDTGELCIEPAQECVGRAALPCPGRGARCFPAGTPASKCASDAPADPPNLVGGGDPDAGPASEQRCPYVDDVCCAGVVDSTVDLGAIDANIDQGVSD